LESFIARRACERGEAAEFDALEANIEQTSAIPLQLWETRLRSYEQFLHLFVGAAHNPLLSELARPLIECTRDLSRRIGPPKKDGVLPIRRSLVAALRKRAPDEASDAVARAMDYIRESWLARA
jgi:DNA-binding GntR family transcriptional regulator